MTVVLDREGLIADRSLVGSVFCRAYSRRVDAWLAQIFETFVEHRKGVALVAVGGYGRAELSPMSDIDVMLLHSKSVDVEDFAGRLWYPVWDEGLRLGHSVRTPKQALALALTDIDTATAILDARCIAGDQAMVDRFRENAEHQWWRRKKRYIPWLAEGAKERHAQDGELAFLLEPNLKSSSGGLRDGHAFRWLLAAGVNVDDRDQHAVTDAYETLLATRVELHRVTGRVGDVLFLEEQDAIAEALGYEDSDVLMANVAGAGRAISWSLEEAWRSSRSGRGRWTRGAHFANAGSGIGVADGGVVLRTDADLSDPLLTLRVTELAARRHLALPRATLETLATKGAVLPEPWPAEARSLFERALLQGHAAIGVLESLDHFGLLVKLIPETAPCRSRPQRNIYHRFTVDRHLFETAAQASLLVDRVQDPGVLVVGALLHDIGKGYPGDHTEVGVELIPEIAHRMGYDLIESQLLVEMCRLHLLLPDVATRRDIDDPDTIRSVAEQVESSRLLGLLDALTEADSISTGPSAWSRWKAGLVGDLVGKTYSVLESGNAALLPRLFPSLAQRELMVAGERMITVADNCVTVVMPDAHDSLWRVAGTFALHGLAVLQADAHAGDGMALVVYQVAPRQGTIDVDALSNDVWRALDGRLAIVARLADRIRLYDSGPRKTSPQPVVPTRVTFDNHSSATATVVEVSATDGLGLMCRVSRALSQQGLDITRAKVQTLGEQAVDTFYVRDRHGQKVSDPDYLGEIRRAVLHGLFVQEQT